MALHLSYPSFCVPAVSCGFLYQLFHIYFIYMMHQPYTSSTLNWMSVVNVRSFWFHFHILLLMFTIRSLFPSLAASLSLSIISFPFISMAPVNSFIVPYRWCFTHSQLFIHFAFRTVWFFLHPGNYKQQQQQNRTHTKTQ